MALWILSRTMRVSQYTHTHMTHPDHQSSFICFLHLLRSMASSVLNMCAWQSLCTISEQVFFGLPLGLALSTSYSIHFFIQSLRSTCPYCRNLLCCSTEITSSNPSLCQLFTFTLTSHIHLTILILAHWSATSFSFLTGQVSLPCNILLHTQLLHNLPLTINDIHLLVSNGTNLYP